MSLQITSFNELDNTRVQELLALFSTWMKERHPEVELSRGVFHDLVLYFNSVLNAAVQENISRIMQSNSLLAITQNPNLSDSTLVDKVLSNFNLTRETGASASGEVTIVVNQAVPTQINLNTKFNANGVTFYPSRTFVGIPPGQDATQTNSREMVPGINGTYAFKITVVADSAGTAGNIPRGTQLVPDVVPSNVSDAYAAVDFTKGVDPPTNAEYIAKLPDGLSAKTIGGKKAFTALIRAQSEFQNIRHLSVVGFGDAEQMRDQHGLFPVSGGGRVDIYAQTHEVAQHIDNFLPAVYIGPAAPGDQTAGTVWQVDIDREQAPGFYAVTRIAKIDDRQNSGYPIRTAVPGYKLTAATGAVANDYLPDIQTLEESSFTRYKTLTVQFVDVDTMPGNLVPRQSTVEYSVTTVGMPMIGQLQDFLASKDIRCRTADVLVKAAVPCFTSIAFKIRRSANEVNPDFTAIKEAIVTAISKIGFAGQLSASVISSVAHQFLTGTQSVGSIDMFGKILRPDGNISYIRDGARIVVPDDPTHMVSAKTVVFLTSVEDIEIAPEIISSYGD
jgi:hypothetical protein